MCSLGKTVSALLVLHYHITASTLEKQNFLYSQKKKKKVLLGVIRNTIPDTFS